MGHHLFMIGRSVLPMRDSDLELVRHFLILGAKDMGLVDLAQAIERWEWQGPGVWVHVEPTDLQRYPVVFDAAVRAVENLGDTIDVAYLNAELKRFGTEWLVPQEARLVVDEINGLRKQVLLGGA
jgi:hypothetical protein